MTGFSALPLTEEGPDELSESQLVGSARILGPRWSHLSTLTVCFLGVQLFWSIEMSYASPYLLSLGLTKSSMAMVFLAGPLSGLIVQPLVGVLADNSKSRFGRRRPFMIGGSVVCAAAMLLMGYTRAVSSIFTSLGTYYNDVLTIWLAILAIFCIDFSINAVQATNRALLVDMLPTAEQASGNAWAARMLGVGSVAGFFVGNIDMPKIFPIFGSEQLEVMSVFASFLLLAVQCVTSTFVKERVLLSSVSGKGSHGFVNKMRILFKNMWTLPSVIRQIFMIQFFSSIAWFPLLFYTTVYVGELHKRASPLPPDADPSATEALEAEANRLGSRALFYSSLISLAANVFLPIFVREARSGQGTTALSPSVERRSCFDRLQVSMINLWAMSYAVFVGCMAATFFTSSVLGATLLISVTGLSWAIAQWAPYSLLAEAVLTEPCADDDRPIRLLDTRTRRTSTNRRLSDEEEERHFLAGDDEEADEVPQSRSSSVERERVDGPQPIVRSSAARVSLADVSVTNGRAYEGEGEEVDSSTGGNGGGALSDKAGIILGIHNIFIVIPQFLVTGMAALVFAIFEPHKSVLHGHHPGIIAPVGNGTSPAAGAVSTNRGTVLLPVRQEAGGAAVTGPNPVAIVFQIGGVSAAVSFFLCLRLARQLRHR